MINAPAHRLGVCSWSLEPGSPAELVERVLEVGVGHVQLALDPLRRGEWGEAETVSRLRDAGIGVLSGMIGMAGEDYSTLESIRATGGVRPDATWKTNLAACRASARLARRLGLPLVTFHAGFIPHEAGPERAAMVARLRELADLFDDHGVSLGFETGQETAATLLEALAEIDRPSVGVNFDPANMLLYGMGDPVEALRALAPRVVQVHVKDAVPSKKKGRWGSEEVAGEGVVDWKAFFGVLRERGLGVDLLIEREGGEKRVKDARKAAKLVRGLLRKGGARKGGKGKRS
jgi:sugar phosphate isomerase/epimerase